MLAGGGKGVESRDKREKTYPVGSLPRREVERWAMHRRGLRL